MRAIRLLPVLALVFAVLHPAPAQSTEADPCEGGPPAWFLGVVYDDEVRSDFVLDVDNFEDYLATLRSTYCIPESNAEILAFEDDFELGGKVYEPATKAATLRTLEAFGDASSGVEDATFFFFLSSHGIMYARQGCPGGSRVVGSLSALGSESRRDDGTLLDCQLGDALNTHFDPDTRMAVFVDCSFCGGFSDSLTAVSGRTVPDGSHPVPSGILGPKRVVVTGCAVTTECFGGSAGGRMYGDLSRKMSVADCDGWTAPGFPEYEGVNFPLPWGEQDGRCSVSEWLFSAVRSAYERVDYIAIQQQYRIKYGFDSLAEDIVVF